MNAEKFLRKFLPIFVITVVVEFVFGQLFDLILFGDFYFNWFGPIRTGITLGIILTLLDYKSIKDDKDSADKD